MKDDLIKIIEKAVLEAFGSDFAMPEIVVDYPKNEAFGDYTTNVAMMLSKELKKSPMEIAEKLSSVIGQQSSIKNIFGKIETVAPGYINFFLSEKYLRNVVKDISKKGTSFGQAEKKEKKVMVEYSQPNTHKEFHIGHLRNVFIGSSLVNILRKSGYETIAANYIGDTGTHIAKCLWGISKFHANENLDQLEDKAQFLGKVYSEAVKAIGEKPEFEEEFKALQKKFEQGDAGLVALWEKTKQWSLDEFYGIYDELGVKFDVYFWESEEEKAGMEMLPKLLETDFIKESQGATIADLEKYGLGILVLVRKDGSALYGMKDIPLAIRKFKEYGIDKSIVVVDIRQGLYFKQIFKILELMGFEKDMEHVGYEFVSLKGSETMSSRKGNIIPARFLIDKMVEKVQEKFPQTKIAKEIGLGAVKFYMLKYSGQSKIEFDMDEALRLEGATGPYVQYAHARICSILEKAQGAGFQMTKTEFDSDSESNSVGLLTHEKELALMRELDKFPAMIEEVAITNDINKVTHYSLSLADKFHSFYNDCKVIDQENSEMTKARLALVGAVKTVLAETLSLIGVSAPERM